jgi:hypothetical protein
MMPPSTPPTASAPAAPIVVLVGHCTPDSGLLTAVLRRIHPALRVERANDGPALDAHRHRGAVWLVNRVLDGEFPSDDGQALLAEEARGGHGQALLLISNRPEAQSRAIADGALPGFGKAELYAPSTTERIRAALSGRGC